MVRFKNRWLLVEFIFPQSLTSTLPLLPSLPTPMDLDPSYLTLTTLNAQDAPADELPIDFYPRQPAFMAPTGNPELGSGAGEKDVWRGVKDSVLESFGDEGWGRVGSSLTVKYHNPITSLTILRVARDHVRTAWAAVTFMNELGGKRCVGRVVGCSGTIKKLQHLAILHSRQTIALYLSHTLQSIEDEKARERERTKWLEVGEVVVDGLRGLED